MSRHMFLYYGFLYILVGFFSANVFLATPILLGLYGVVFVISLYLLWKHKSINPGILVLASAFTFLYTWLSWTDHSVYYQPDGIHLLVGVVLVVYGLVFADKYAKKTS